LLTSALTAGEGGRISGIVQREGQGIPEHRIMLIRFGPAGEVQRIPGQTDAAGKFVFDNLETGEAFEYVVGIRYAGQLYRSAPMRLEEEQHRTGIIVEVSTAEAAVTQSPVQMVNHLLVMVLRNDHLEVREVIRLLNSGSSPFVGTATQPGEGYSLHLPLPQAYYNLTDVQGLKREHIRTHVSGLYYTAPLDPGEHRIMYTYSLPLHKNVTTILVERLLPTAVFEVLVQDKHLVATSDLQFHGQISVEPHTFLHFRGADLAGRSRSWLQVTRRTEPAPFLRIATYSLIIGMVLLGVGIPLYGAWRNRARQEPTTPMTSEQLQALNVVRLRLLRTIARLDEQRAAGSIEDHMYQQQRRASKTQLVELVEQLQQGQRNKENLP
jgi:hypothetical protein